MVNQGSRKSSRFCSPDTNTMRWDFEPSALTNSSVTIGGNSSRLRAKIEIFAGISTERICAVRRGARREVGSANAQGLHSACTSESNGLR